MPLQFIDKSQVVAWIIDAWQREFDTEMDPSDGQWFTNGPGNTRKGLFGGLTDRLASELIYEESSEIFTPHQKAVATYVVNNLDGRTPEATAKLSYTHSDITTSTHATSKAIKTGIAEEIKVKADFLATGAESTTKFSFEFTYSWSDSYASQEGEAIQSALDVPVKVPKGRVYQVQMLCNADTLTIPYRALVRISGQSEANFPGPVRGKKRWFVDAGELCSWINQHGSAGEQSERFGENPDIPGEGFLALRGTMTAKRNTNFTALTLDVTDSYTGGREASDAEGELVAIMPLPS